MTRIIFLDIDGVLAIPPPGRKTILPSRQCVEQLNRVTDATGAKLVLSSGRRFEPDLELVLADWGVRASIIGSTPIAGNGLGGRRYEEIAGWLAAYAEPIGSFAILDDDPDMGPLQPFLVRTEFEKGLTEELAKEAIRKLMKRVSTPKVKL